MRNRSVVEILVLLLATVIGLTIIGLGVVIVLVEVFNPEADTSPAVDALKTMVTAITGALLGLVANRSSDLSRRPDKE